MPAAAFMMARQYRLAESARVLCLVSTRIPLQRARIQPYVPPKIELSDQRTEKADVQILRIVSQFRRPAAISLYPGELVDVCIAAKP